MWITWVSLISTAIAKIHSHNTPLGLILFGAWIKYLLSNESIGENYVCHFECIKYVMSSFAMLHHILLEIFLKRDSATLFYSTVFALRFKMYLCLSFLHEMKLFTYSRVRQQQLGLSWPWSTLLSMVSKQAKP